MKLLSEFLIIKKYWIKYLLNKINEYRMNLISMYFLSYTRRYYLYMKSLQIKKLNKMKYK